MPLRTPIIPPDIQPAYPSQIADPDVRPQLIELLGLPEIPAALDLTTTDFDEANGVRSTHLTYFNSLNETVPGILMEPLGDFGEQRPRIVCVSGTGGSAHRVAHPEFHQSPEGPLVGWGCELAGRGFTTLAISAKGTGPIDSTCASQKATTGSL